MGNILITISWLNSCSTIPLFINLHRASSATIQLQFWSSAKEINSEKCWIVIVFAITRFYIKKKNNKKNSKSFCTKLSLLIFLFLILVLTVLFSSTWFFLVLDVYNTLNHGFFFPTVLTFRSTSYDYNRINWIHRVWMKKRWVNVAPRRCWRNYNLICDFGQWESRDGKRLVQIPTAATEHQREDEGQLKKKMESLHFIDDQIRTLWRSRNKYQFPSIYFSFHLSLSLSHASSVFNTVKCLCIFFKRHLLFGFIEMNNRLSLVYSPIIDWSSFIIELVQTNHWILLTKLPSRYLFLLQLTWINLN